MRESKLLMAGMILAGMILANAGFGTVVHSQTTATPTLVAFLRAVPNASSEELETLSTAVRTSPTESLPVAFRIRLANQIGVRYEELKQPKEALEQFQYAVSQPHPAGKDGRDCAVWWNVAMDSLLWHYRRSGQSDQIIAALDRCEHQAVGTSFSAIFLTKRGKWLRYVGEGQVAKDQNVESAVKLFEAIKRTPCNYELQPMIELANEVGFHDRGRQLSMYRKLESWAEASVRDDHGGLRAFHAFASVRERMSKATATGALKQEEIAPFTEGIDELAELARKSSKGADSEKDRERITLIQELFHSGQKRLQDQIEKSLLGRAAPKLVGVWLDSQRTEILNQFSGRIVVLDFWAIWCGPCIESFSIIQSLHEEFSQSDRVSIIGVTTWYGYVWDADKKVAIKGERSSPPENEKEVQQMERQAIRNFLDIHKVTYPQLVASERLIEAFGVQGFPTLVVIDQSGKVANVITGSDSEARLRIAVQKLLKEE